MVGAGRISPVRVAFPTTAPRFPVAATGVRAAARHLPGRGVLRENRAPHLGRKDGNIDDTRPAPVPTLARADRARARGARSLRTPAARETARGAPAGRGRAGGPPRED